MDLNNIYDILNSFKDAIESLKGDVEQIKSQVNGMDEMYHGLDEKLSQTEKFLYDELLSPMKKAFDQNLRAERFGEWSDKYADKLSPLNDHVRSIEGDPSIDLVTKTFDEFYATPEETRQDADAYVDGIVAQVTDRVAEIKKALGLPEEAEVTVTEDSVEAKVDGETVAEIPTEPVAEETTEEPIADETPTEEPVAENEVTEVSEDIEEDDPEEVAKFEEELKASLKK